MRYNTIYKIIYLSRFVSLLRINNLNKSNINIVLQDVFFFENINNTYRYKDRL